MNERKEEIIVIITSHVYERKEIRINNNKAKSGKRKVRIKKDLLGDYEVKKSKENININTFFLFIIKNDPSVLL